VIVVVWVCVLGGCGGLRLWWFVMCGFVFWVGVVVCGLRLWWLLAGVIDLGD
jgi:hypothetical protein